MKLPLLLSVPHAGLTIPPEAKPYCRLTSDDVMRDSDEGAAQIYNLAEHVDRFVTTDVARAIVDLNRAESDRTADGVVKTHTCWSVKVYDCFPPEEVVEQLLCLYYRPYHERLEEGYIESVRLGLDCHTMAQVGPPVGPDAGKARPLVCLGDARGTTLPAGWMDCLTGCFLRAFDGDVKVNEPFAGGYITRTHGKRRPWVQVELSREPSFSMDEKRERVLRALEEFCTETFGP
ncbi:MAG: N-formylglutamate amidohydrolase [Candidatus Eiseniibacteriota bacterium]|nr:MAG: N-formylglutamate amidohydrolase [Candidatus Eisenbacteria bacterium]